MNKPYNKILVLGSGALKIGEAGVFDYATNQAIKAFKEDALQVIVINPNIATYHTSFGIADGVYFVPVMPEIVLRIIKQEQPDAILLHFGGQTALTCGLELQKQGIFTDYGIDVLGTDLENIAHIEDRLQCKQILESIQVEAPQAIACESIEQAIEAGQKIGYPVILRTALTIGIKGNTQARTAEQLQDIAKIALVESDQIVVEEDLTGWKEIEFEVVRDIHTNCIAVCTMEHIDPLGIHAGESIVVIPCQTLDNLDYQTLRTVAFKVARQFNIIGACTIRFAVHQKSRKYRTVGINAHLSRSSALASKATGYPLAYITAKLALGYSLPELTNLLTNCTTANFEPVLDYVALKMPRWDLQKFHFVSKHITSEMKSVGEVLAIGKTIEEVLQKAVRMLNIGMDGLGAMEIDTKVIKEALVRPTPHRIFAIFAAFKAGWSVTEVQVATGIDVYFLERIEHVFLLEAMCLKTTKFDVQSTLLAKAKQAGMSDVTLARLLECEPSEIRTMRLEHKIAPYIVPIDAQAGAFPAGTNYLYTTYNTNQSEVIFNADASYVLLLGSGPYTIGSSLEYDWCCMHAMKALQAQGHTVVMLNNNPEAVSTDYLECNNLLIDELSLERVLDLVDAINPVGVVLAMGGQISNSLALALAKANVPILGTSASMIDTAEDRFKFSTLLDLLDIDQPAWRECSDLETAKQFAVSAGYPIMARPSYVLSGTSMTVLHSNDALEAYIKSAAYTHSSTPIVLTKFETGAKAIEVDAVAQAGQVLVYAILEQIENAGVHSGDATLVLPPQKLTLETIRRLKIITKEAAAALHISGPFSLQFIFKNNRLKVIACNLRAGRNFPFVSKTLGVNLITIAIQAMFGTVDTTLQYQTIDLDYVAVKVPQFSFNALKGADPQLGVEMTSTGEVSCIGHTAEQGLAQAILATGFKIPEKNILVSVGNLDDKVEIFASLKQLHKLGFAFYATKHTHDFLLTRGIESVLLHSISEPRSPNVREYLERKRVHLVFNIPTHPAYSKRTDGYYMRRLAMDYGIPLLTNVQLIKRITEALAEVTLPELPLLRWSECIQQINVHKKS